MYAEPRGNAEVRELATQLYREQRPYLEIAEHRGWTYSKVDRCVRRGRGRLRATSPLTS